MAPLTQLHLDQIKGGVAVLGVALAVWGVLREPRVGESHRRPWDKALLVLGFFALLCWWNLGKFHFSTYLHRWELYHYVVGAKYFRELGYEGLYRCSTVADAEALGADDVRGRSIRNLATNRIESAETVLHDPGRCEGRVSRPSAGRPSRPTSAGSGDRCRPCAGGKRSRITASTPHPPGS